MSSIELKPGQSARLLPGDKAKRLADLNGIQRDLVLVRNSCRVIESRKESLSDGHVRRACFDSAVMRYRRCFNNGIRKLLPRSLPELLNDDERALHDRILQLADRSVAHCVDGSEENLAYVLVGPPANGIVPLDVSVLTGTVSHHNVIDAMAFEALANKVWRIARDEAEEIAAEILKELLEKSAAEIEAFEEIKRSITGKGEMLSEKYRGKIKGQTAE